jgi:hypothetical protein
MLIRKFQTRLASLALAMGMTLVAGHAVSAAEPAAQFRPRKAPATPVDLQVAPQEGEKASPKVALPGKLKLPQAGQQPQIKPGLPKDLVQKLKPMKPGLPKDLVAEVQPKKPGFPMDLAPMPKPKKPWNPDKLAPKPKDQFPGPDDKLPPQDNPGPQDEEQPDNNGQGNGNGNGNNHNDDWKEWLYWLAWIGHNNHNHHNHGPIYGDPQPPVIIVPQVPQIAVPLPQQPVVKRFTAPMGSDLPLGGVNFGEETGHAILQVGELFVALSAPEWTKDAIVVRLPALGLLAAANADLHMYDAEGNLLSTVPLKLTPAE